jgi:hypothetical protein
MPALPFVVLCCGIPLILAVLHAFDQLVLLERTQHVSEWEAEGEPHPIIFRGGLKWSRSLRSHFATQRCALVWLFVAPKWSREDANAQRHIRRLRILTAVWNFAFMPMYAAVLYLSIKSGR